MYTTVIQFETRALWIAKQLLLGQRRRRRWTLRLA